MANIVHVHAAAPQREDPFEHNGGTVVAMLGKKCVAIASDKRFGMGATTLSTEVPKVFEMGPKLYVGLPGLATDTVTVKQRLTFRKNLYELQEKRLMSPKVLSSVLSNLLYERRFAEYYINPIVAGLDYKTGKPYVCSMDLIGCKNEPEDFVVAGVNSELLYGMCETLWRPDLSPGDIFESISQALVNACDRDARSGFGAVVYIIERDQITEKHVKTRMD